jgi:spermidine synthase
MINLKGIWFSELQESGLAISCEIKEVLYSKKSKFQDIKVVDTKTFGKMLLLDDVIQTTIKDEFVYHEMITMVALNTHPNPENVLVIGGGDGGSIREIVKHPGVKKVTLVEIDEYVVEAGKKYLPEISQGLNNPKAKVLIDDGIKHVQDSEAVYDIIIVDSTDPVGPAEGLFGEKFYKSVYKALKSDGIFVAQTESPFFNQDILENVLKYINDIYGNVRLYLANVPTYPGGLWSFTMGTKKYLPENVNIDNIPELNTKYYSREIHKSCFVLPPFVKELFV